MDRGDAVLTFRSIHPSININILCVNFTRASFFNYKQFLSSLSCNFQYLLFVTVKFTPSIIYPMQRSMFVNEQHEFRCANVAKTRTLDTKAGSKRDVNFKLA